MYIQNVMNWSSLNPMAIYRRYHFLLEGEESNFLDSSSVEIMNALCGFNESTFMKAVDIYADSINFEMNRNLYRFKEKELPIKYQYIVESALKKSICTKKVFLMGGFDKQDHEWFFEVEIRKNESVVYFRATVRDCNETLIVLAHKLAKVIVESVEEFIKKNSMKN